MKKKAKPEKKESYLDGKFQGLGMSLGMCFGISIGTALGSLLFHNVSIGMCMGLSCGMCLGIALGSAKDKKIAAEALVIADILEEDFGCEGVPEDAELMVTLVLLDIDGKEQRRQVPDKLATEKDLQPGDRIWFNEQGEIEKYKRGVHHE